MLISLGTAAVVSSALGAFPAFTPFVGPPGASAAVGAAMIGVGAGMVLAGDAAQAAIGGGQAGRFGSGGAGGGSVGTSTARDFGRRAPRDAAPEGFQSFGFDQPRDAPVQVFIERSLIGSNMRELGRLINDAQREANTLRGAT
jgi:hypothetical protein